LTIATNHPTLRTSSRANARGDTANADQRPTVPTLGPALTRGASVKTTHGLQFKFADGGNAIEGYAARFGEKDLASDIIAPGAFAKSLAELQAAGHRLPMLWAHDQSETVGSWAELREDEAGLYAVGAINPDVERGREALSLIKGGDLSGLSIGYQVARGGRTDKEGVSYLTEIKLLEISIVAVPAASKARIVLKDFTALEDFAAFLRSTGVSRREAEFVARKSWPAITAGPESEPSYRPVITRLRKSAREMHNLKELFK
jgi:HK97 family phage prohead protease